MMYLSYHNTDPDLYREDMRMSEPVNHYIFADNF